MITRSPASGLVLHRRKTKLYHFEVTLILDLLLHQPNLTLTIIKGKTRTKQPADRPMLRKDAHDRLWADLPGVHWHLWPVGSSALVGSQR